MKCKGNSNSNRNPQPNIKTTNQYTLPSFQISNTQIQEFQENGFIAFPDVFDTHSVSTLNDRLEFVLRGVYNSGKNPDKQPKLIQLPLPDGVVLSGEEEEDKNEDEDQDEDVRMDYEHKRSPDLIHKQEQEQEQEQLIYKYNASYNSNNIVKEDNFERINNPKEEREITKNNDNKDESKHSSTSSSSSPLQISPPSESATATTTTCCKTHTNITIKKKSKKKKQKPIGPLGFSGNTQSNKVMQIINVHKCDTYFRQLVTTNTLGYMVSTLMQWKDGARLAQDQIWAKPPGSPPLAYHRDSPYFMFTPHSVATVWIALDDMDDEDIGPLTYVKSSHKWNDGRVGSSHNFFQSNGGKALLYSAAERSGVVRDVNDLEYVSMKGLMAGGLSIHDGLTWHGSKGNKTDNRPRRGIGLHFVPVNVKWTRSAMNSRLWRKYVADIVEDGGDVDAIELDECDFPIVYRKKS